MNKKDLLRDLHFQLSNDGSGNVSPNGRAVRIIDNNKLQLEVEDRKVLTEIWVAHVHLRNRQRSLSSDSYFGAYSVCDNLKKSFLKPCRVTEDELEDLRMRLAQVKLEDSNTDMNSDQSCKVENCDTESNPSRIIVNATTWPVVKRCRSRTVSPLKFLQMAPSNEVVSPTSEKNKDVACNLASIQSVDLIKDILFDENCNLMSTNYDPEKPKVDSKPTNTEDVKLCNFRDVSVFPSPNELKDGKSSKLFPNRIAGKYRNGEDYLRTQFYLLREDFIRPLKEGIADYRKQLSSGTTPNEVKNLKLYHNVHVIGPRIKENKLGIAIEMGFPLSEKIGDKDFMEGSLVLLSPNHFDEIFVGTVVSHTFFPRRAQQDKRSSRRKGKKSNILIVQLHAASHFGSILRHGSVLLAESQAFFQPYFYVMKIFQGMTDDDLPLKDCIVSSKRQAAVSCPTYLRWNTEYILENTYKVGVMKSTTWPSANVLNVNDSQLTALKKALSQRLVLIQGPPGTGKTYLGCKVAKALLENRPVWNRLGNQPMLLMCQTNHALDQFMELLLPVSKKVIRIGNQSKSDLLAPFNIREWVRKSRSRSSRHTDALKQEMELKRLALDIQKWQLEMMKVSSHGVLDLETLVNMEVIDQKSSVCFVNSENFLLWLEDARKCQDFHKRHQACVLTSHNSSACFKHEFERHSLEQSPMPLEIKLDNGGYRPCGSLNVDINYIVSLPNLEFALKEQEADELPEEGSCDQMIDLVAKKEKEDRLKFFQRCILQKAETDTEISIGSCLWSVPPCKRWILYWSWIRKLKMKLQSHLEVLESLYLDASTVFADLKQYEKLGAMRQAELVGMTTSAAARLYPILRELNCPIALVEEAAEVYEPHIVATITKHCQHLILLGDHKQLRPRPASYSLSRTHFTDVSLFERLLLNNTVTVNTLLIQHRMQPEISALIRPSIYPELYDHKCTRSRKNIPGMVKNVFFFSHQWPESRNLLTGSFSNLEEAKMAVQIVRYLLKESCSANEVCILTAYREQVSVIEEICKEFSELEGIRVLTIDNFQGEESKIVVLSLVRNNSENQIGFLKIENRVCVALSRARDGLYILGNIELLSRNSNLWSSVNKVLQSSASVGWSLPLNCRRHPRKHKSIFQPNDLEQYMNSGGCQRICSYKLVCGHSCKRVCHSDDRLHLQNRCEEPCKKTCAFGHKCFQKCFEECDDCEALVWKHLACGHPALTKCSLDLDSYLCGVTVNKCMEPCLHKVNVQCWMPSTSRKYCPHQCPTLLKCGHRCPLRCNSLKHPNHNMMKCGSCERVTTSDAPNCTVKF